MGGEAGILLIYLIGLLVLNKNVPSDYQDLRHEWDSGLVQAYLTGESNESEKYENQKEHPISKRITSKDQLPPYAPFTASDTWLNFSSEKQAYSFVILPTGRRQKLPARIMKQYYFNNVGPMLPITL